MLFHSPVNSAAHCSQTKPRLHFVCCWNCFIDFCLHHLQFRYDADLSFQISWRPIALIPSRNFGLRMCRDAPRRERSHVCKTEVSITVDFAGCQTRFPCTFLLKQSWIIAQACVVHVRLAEGWWGRCWSTQCMYVWTVMHKLVIRFLERDILPLGCACWSNRYKQQHLTFKTIIDTEKGW